MKSAAAHVAAPHEPTGNSRRSASTDFSRSTYLGGGDASEQHHLGARRGRRERREVAKERAPVAPLVGIDGNARARDRVRRVARELRVVRPGGGARGAQDCLARSPSRGVLVRAGASLGPRGGAAGYGRHAGRERALRRVARRAARRAPPCTRRRSRWSPIGARRRRAVPARRPKRRMGMG